MRYLLYSTIALLSLTSNQLNAQSISDPVDLSIVTKSLTISQRLSQSAMNILGTTIVFNFTKAKPIFSIENCSAIQFKFSQLLQTNVENITNLSLFGFIDEWWATRYRYGGTTKRGIDCSAFTGLLLREVYGRLMPRTAREQYAACEKLDESELQEGDLVFFNTTGGVSHVGIYLSDGFFAHSCSSKGVSINNLQETYYKSRFIKGGRPALEKIIDNNVDSENCDLAVS